MKKQKYLEVDGVKIPLPRYYKTASNNYVKEDFRGWYVLRKGELEYDMYFGRITFAEIEATEITEEEFNDALQKSKDGVEGYK